MQVLKKYAAVLVLLASFPLIRFIANNFILESSRAIYSHIPQESDLIIEINTQNFISEMAYQRFFEEIYFMDKVYPETEEGQMESRYINTGINLFEKVVLFREQWANESSWIAIVKVDDRAAFKHFITDKIPDVHYEFGNEYAIVQLSPSSNQENMNEHLRKIASKEIKAFTERVDLASLFDKEKEINCYIIPKTTAHNQLIDGYLSFDFLKDHIAITGNFTPVPEFKGSAPIAYALNPEAAFSLRSSLNLFNSIYWFNEEKLEGVPEYNQMAFDYNGVDCYMINRNMGYSTPFKSFPKMNLHFDILDASVWYNFFDSLHTQQHVFVDSVNKQLTTAQGAFFHYDLTKKSFRLSQEEFELEQANEPELYFDLSMHIDDMINNTQFEVDTLNPPNELEQSMGLAIARGIVNQIRSFANIETINFQLRQSGEDNISANGRIDMKEKNGQSIVESLSFGTAAFTFLQSF